VDWVKTDGNNAHGWLYSLALRALDVFAKEFPDDFTLIDHPNVTPIPHLGAAAKEGQQRAGLEVVKILKERLA